MKTWSIPAELIQTAERTEKVTIVDGKTEYAVPVLVVVAVGANRGLLRRAINNTFPDQAKKEST